MENKVFKRMAASLSILIMVTLIGSACAPAVILQPVNGEATSQAAMQPTLDALRLQLNQTATAEKIALIQQATSSSLTRTAAVTPIPTSTFTPTPNLLGTQAASAMFLKVKQYTSENYLPSTDGFYLRLFSQYFIYSTDVNHLKWTETGLVLEDFALETDLAWEDSTRTSWASPAVCGFIFHSDGNSNYIMAYLGLDGYVYMYSTTNGEFHPLGKSPFGNVEASQGNAHIALVVNGNHYAFFVDDKMIMQSKSELDTLKTGQLAFVVESDSNKESGTTCKFTNIDLWTVKPSE